MEKISALNPVALKYRVQKEKVEAEMRLLKAVNYDCIKQERWVSSRVK